MTLCEIDRGVIDLCRQHFPEVSAGAYDDPRTRIVIADGTKFVAETDDRFDVIMIDFDRSGRARRRAVHARVLCRLPALPRARRPARHAERPALPAGLRAQAERRLSSASCSATPSPISPPRRAISAARCPMAGPPTMPSCRHHKRRKIERRYDEGRRLPDALLAPRRPCRGLRAADLCARAGRGLAPRAAPASADRRRAGGNRRRRRHSRRSTLR